MFGQKTALLATLQGDRIWISIVLLNPRIRVSTTKLLNSVYAMVTYEIGLEFQRAYGRTPREAAPAARALADQPENGSGYII